MVIGRAIILFTALFAAGEAVAACPATMLPLTLTAGLTPYVRLAAGGRAGNFLLDYGATYSTLSRSDYPGASDPLLVADLSLPGPPRASFRLADFGQHNIAGGQLGVIGTDLLSLRTASFDFVAGKVAIGSVACDAADFAGEGLVAVPQDGFFSDDLTKLPAGRPNVPILRMAIGTVAFWAQIDSGYGDRLYPTSLDANAALIGRLRAAGVPMTLVGSVGVSTCEGVEERQVWRAGAAATLALASGATRPGPPDLYIIAVAPNGCGGIARLDEPAGLLGASALGYLGRIAFDPWNRAVWVPPR